MSAVDLTSDEAGSPSIERALVHDRQQLRPTAEPAASDLTESRRRRPTDWRTVRVLLAKDVQAARRSKAVVIPMLVVPFVLLVGLPTGIGIFARVSTGPDVSGLMSRLPSSMAAEFAVLPARQQLIELVLGYLVAPLFLIVPMMISSALAADTFAGEKERRTLESLLHMPVEERELFISKVLFAFLPTVAASWIGFTLYALSVNVVAWPVMGRVFVPTWRWIALIGYLAPAVAALGLGIMVRVSARARTTQEANQLGGAVIMPLILLSVGQTSGLLMLPPYWLVVSGTIVWALAALLIRGGMKRFTRDRVAATM